MNDTVYNVFDSTGDTAERFADWCQNRQGVNVWQNVDLSSPRIGTHAFTPGDRNDPPHWQLSLLEARITDMARFRIYRRALVTKRFTSTPSGYRAACREASRLNDSAEKINPRSAPIGNVWRAFTVDGLQYDSDTRVQRVIEWVAIDRA
jgi:hypothetical protein